MIRTYQAELVKLARRKVVWITAAVIMIFSVGGAAVVLGALSPRTDIPRLLDMYRGGSRKLDELITTRYSLDQINEGYQAMRDGTNIRGVIEFA